MKPYVLNPADHECHAESHSNTTLLHLGGRSGGGERGQRLISFAPPWPQGGGAFNVLTVKGLIQMCQKLVSYTDPATKW